MVVEEDLQRRAELRIGTVLRGKYHIDRVLGVGGMAVVYAATHRNQKQFAVKMLHPEISIRGDVRARFLREGYAANSVRHPGAVAVLDDDVADDGAAFLVMELLDGTNVETLCDRLGQKLPLRDALCITHQLLDVLDAAHANAVVHRDIKPANLLLLRDGQLKVLDFGIARLRDAAVSQPSTRTGSMLGTPAFMAPEQAMARAGEIDAQTDVWAAGATLFTMISGRLVHEGENAQQILVRAATTRAPSLGSIAPQVPPPIVEIVAKALSFDKAGRWRSAAAMRDALAAEYERNFGEAPSPRQLTLLSTELGMAATAVQDVAPAATPASLGRDAGLGLATTAATTTANPVSSRPSGRATEEPSPRRGGRPGIVLVGAAALATAAGAALLYAKSSDHGGGSEAAPASPQPSRISPPPASEAALPSIAPAPPAALPSISPAPETRIAVESPPPWPPPPMGARSRPTRAIPKALGAAPVMGSPSAPDAAAMPGPAAVPTSRNPLDMILK
jgi:eukaryotic-like serine/threonine-protein kinase